MSWTEALRFHRWVDAAGFLPGSAGLSMGQRVATPFPAENILSLFHFAASSVEKGSLTGVSHLNLPFRGL